ncbi:hypothetical protein WJX82_003906 [Trebouxia sp. C0006]
MDGLLGRFTPKPLRKLAGSLLGIRTQQKKEATHKREASQAKHHLSSASDVLHDSRRYSETRLEQQSNKTQPSAAVQEISQTLKALRQVTADAVAAGHKLSASTHVLEVREQLMDPYAGLMHPHGHIRPMKMLHKKAGMKEPRPAHQSASSDCCQEAGDSSIVEQSKPDVSSPQASSLTTSFTSCSGIESTVEYAVDDAQVSTPGSITNMTQKGGSWHSEAKPGSASTPVSSPESQQPCSPLQEAASAVDEQQTSHSSSQALVSEIAALTKMGLKQSNRTLVAELQPQKERTASAERRLAGWRATDTSELEAALRAARTETVGLTHSVKDLKGLLSGESERSKGLQQQLAEAQSIQKVSSAQASSTSWEQAGASTSEDAAPSATSWRPWTIVSLLRQHLLDREEYYRHGIQLLKECLDAMIVKEDIPALERQLEVKNQQLTHCQAR